MILADWIIIGILALFCVLGALLGFGKGLKIFTKGIIGFIISIVICYALGGLIYNISFVHKLLDNFRDVLIEKDNGFCNFLLKIQIDIVVYYVVLFIVVTIARIIIVHIISAIAEADNRVMNVFNRIFGVVLFAGVMIFLLLMAFWIIALIKGPYIIDFPELADSKIGLDWLYENNPFTTIIKAIQKRV